MKGNPQLEDGFTRVANELLEALLAAPLSGQEFRIALTVIRKTYGYRKKVDRISMGQFEKETGITKKRCQLVMKELVEKNIIIKGGSFWKPTYGPQKNYKQWKFQTTPQEEGPPQEKGKVPPKRGVKLPPCRGATKDSKDTSKDSSNEEKEIKEVFESYNVITKIRSRSDSRKSKIRVRLKEYGKERILGAIENYQRVLDDPTNHWTHRFPIERFMTPENIDRFLAMELPAEEEWPELADGAGFSPS